MADVTVTLVESNYEEYVKSLEKMLSGKSFNVLVTEPKTLKFCRRKLTGKIWLKNGQVSMEMEPGGSIAWDLNNERVAICFIENGDIQLVRIIGGEKRKVVLITENPI